MEIGSWICVKVSAIMRFSNTTYITDWHGEGQGFDECLRGKVNWVSVSRNCLKRGLGGLLEELHALGGPVYACYIFLLTALAQKSSSSYCCMFCMMITSIHTHFLLHIPLIM